MQLVLLGDGEAEERLTKLAHRSTAAAAMEGDARAVLEMVCCGLCGAAPAFTITTAAAAASPAAAAGPEASSAAAAAEEVESGEGEQVDGDGSPG